MEFMIAHLEGHIRGVREGAVILAVGGVGYKVSVTTYALGKLSGNTDQIVLHIYTQVREDVLALYGFLEEEELKMFELLIGVSGIGPKAALSILSIADVIALQTAIVNEDSSVLTRVSGIGKKTAERVVLELKNKVADIGEISQKKSSSDSDAMEALMAMGYNVGDARDALKSVPDEIEDVGEKVKVALKSLGKN
jgi:Holliday junction DNA helicase RuvA